MMRVTLDDGSWADVDELTYEALFAAPPRPTFDEAAVLRLVHVDQPRKPTRAAPTRRGGHWALRRAEYLRRKHG